MAFAEAYVDDCVARAELLYETRVEEADRRIGDANHARQALQEELSTVAPEDRPAIRRQIAQQTQVTVAGLMEMLSPPAASPEAGVLSYSADQPTGPFQPR